jgi:Tfp pilus assembly protein PilF
MFSRTPLWTGPVFAVLLMACATLSRTATPAPADKPQVWVEVQTPHFLVTSDDGEKTARRIAEEFEQIRYLYLHAFKPGIRVDPSLPIVIFAMKNERSLSQILPEYWAEKGHVHPSGIFDAGSETNYIALEADIQGEFPYQTVYHEYVHLIVNLNFHNFPLWLNEGLADFFSSAQISGKSAELGVPSARQIVFLQHTDLLPIDTLFKVDRHSPYYNEAEKTNVFYAESWALIHYLFLDPDKQRPGQLDRYESLVEDGIDALTAAQTVFGDLSKLTGDLRLYVARSAYSHFVLPMEFDKTAITSKVRTVPLAEAESRLADFDMSRGQLDAARPRIESAMRLDPKLAAPYESMGLLLYRQEKHQEADKYFERAISLGSKSALTYFYHGISQLSGPQTKDSADEAQGAFEKAVALNPNAAPAWTNLATLYMRYEETAEQAVHAATQAVNLAPATGGYQFNLGLALVHADRYEEAQKIVARLRASSDSESAALADRLAAQLDSTQRYTSARVAEKESRLPSQLPSQLGDGGGGPITIRRRPETGGPENTPPGAIPKPVPRDNVTSSRVYSMVGTITEVNCNSLPEMLVTLKSLNIVMRLHASDAEKFVTSATGAKPPPKGLYCMSLRSQTARIGYLLTPGKNWDGEVQTIELRATAN